MQGGIDVPEIIKDGSFDKFVNNQFKWKRFYCYECGCDFNAHKKEYRYIFHKFGYYCACPTCSSMVREHVDHSYDYFL